MLLFETIPSGDYCLKDNQIDVWEFPLIHPPVQADSLLDSTERARAKRYHFPRHQRRFTAARAMLRLILARYLKQEASQLLFTYGKHGKPQVENCLQLEFNLSHSRDLALLAIGRRFPIGIDLEFFSPRPYEGIAKHSFSPKELQLFSTLPNFLKPLIFFHIWAQKEAFIKASGLGLAYPTQQFDVPITPPSDELISDPLHEIEWQMVSFMPQLTCSAALCYNPQINKIRYQIIKDPTIF
ncbi:4'-phosphopantetheinyl transferase family protein [Legionella feeleii]|uniref:Phosphopantetheinyl transferase n=1 Tax=Legionella feeleii TaxID=453 RepID=A0A378IUV1_9GAMM|nr:4'-phosphopantetheinyl transferase superfamily protein [Legionella feeleii]STX38929.1 phosphopantetheinyl transferase [Legionella feeleii]